MGSMWFINGSCAANVFLHGQWLVCTFLGDHLDLLVFPSLSSQHGHAKIRVL